MAQRRAELQGQMLARRWEEPSPTGPSVEASPDADKAPSEPPVEASPGADKALIGPAIEASPASVLDRAATPEASPEPAEPEATQHYSPEPVPAPVPHLLSCQAK